MALAHTDHVYLHGQCNHEHCHPVMCRVPLCVLNAGEKAALMARLAKLKDAGAGELQERAELQEALVR